MGTATERRLAVVTGASSGIGRALAAEFARHGFDLVIAAENEKVAAAGRELAEHGTTVTDVRTDLATFDGVERLYEAILDLERPVDAVAVNAGIGAAGDFTRDIDLATELKLVNLNVTSAVHLAKLVLPGMVRRGSGRLLFTSSVAGTMPGPYEATYAASKAFLLAFSEALRQELKDSGITVTALLPGPTDTEFFDRAGMADSAIARGPKDDPAQVAREAYAAMMEGRDKVVAGSFMNRVQATAAKVVPEPVKARLHGVLAKPR